MTDEENNLLQHQIEQLESELRSRSKELEALRCQLRDTSSQPAYTENVTHTQEVTSGVEPENAELSLPPPKRSELATLSHELRTPLSTILGMTRLALETSLSQEQEDYLRSIFVSSQSALELVESALDKARMETGLLKLEQVTFELSDLLRTVNDMLKLRAELKQLSFECHLDPALPPFVLGDPLRLRQVLINLVGNAIKFTQTGSVTVYVEQTDRRTDERSKSESVEMLFRVVDTGIGIPENLHDRIFESYAQLEQPRGLKERGSGLGLSICKSLIALMEGEIWVESREGEGTTFFFLIRLPVLEEHQLNQHLLASGGALLTGGFQPTLDFHMTQALQRTKLLLAEDNPGNQKAAKRLLEKAGLVVEVADHGAEAVKLFQRGGFDLVILDREMPTMDGLEAAVRIREWEKEEFLTPTSLLLLSSPLSEQEWGTCAEIGFQDQLVKPLQKSTLLSSVQSWRDNRPRVLIAEDDWESRRLLYLFLKSEESVRLVFARDGQEAVNKFSTFPPALVFLDLEMPVMDGLRSMKTIRGMAGGQQVPILALSGHDKLESKRFCLEQGFDGYLQKPMDKRSLVKTIHHFLALT